MPRMFHVVLSLALSLATAVHAQPIPSSQRNFEISYAECVVQIAGEESRVRQKTMIEDCQLKLEKLLLEPLLDWVGTIARYEITKDNTSIQVQVISPVLSKATGVLNPTTSRLSQGVIINDGSFKIDEHKIDEQYQSIVNTYSRMQVGEGSRLLMSARPIRLEFSPFGRTDIRVRDRNYKPL